MIALPPLIPAGGVLALALLLAPQESQEPPAPPSPVLEGDTEGSQPDEAYEIAPKDVLLIVVRGQERMTGNFTVDDEGVLNFPALGRVQAAGLTAGALERRLKTLLLDGYLKRPEITVAVREYKSQRVFVTGPIPRPGYYVLKGDRRILGLLNNLGDLGVVGHEIVVTRQPSQTGQPIYDLTEIPTDAEAVPPPIADTSETQELRLSLAKIRAGEPDHNIVLRAGDKVVLSQPAHVYVNGQVERPGGYRYREGLTVYEALNLAGGITGKGSKKVKLIRVIDGVRKEFKIGMMDPVLPEDTIVVPQRFF
jgi:polysaccharide export outer membrane protein